MSDEALTRRTVRRHERHRCFCALRAASARPRLLVSLHHRRQQLGPRVAGRADPQPRVARQERRRAAVPGARTAAHLPAAIDASTPGHRALGRRVRHPLHRLLRLQDPGDGLPADTVGGRSERCRIGARDPLRLRHHFPAHRPARARARGRSQRQHRGWLRGHRRGLRPRGRRPRGRRFLGQCRRHQHPHPEDRGAGDARPARESRRRPSTSGCCRCGSSRRAPCRREFGSSRTFSASPSPPAAP